jgi:putative addiction module killer protein
MDVRKTDVFSRWLDRLTDVRGRARILVPIERLATGNPGDVKPMSQGVSDIRVDFGPGYRIYYKQQGKTVIILLAGGDKTTQARDIETALKLAWNL